MGGRQQVIFGYEGTILIDPETAELVRLTARTLDVERETPYCEAATTLDYTRVRIGKAEFLLPREALQRFVSVSRFLTENIVTFSECREFRADSTLSFGAAPDPQPAGETPPATPQLDVPSGLPFTLELTTRIDSTTAAAGDPFAGKLTTPITDEHGKEYAPAGAIVRGRLTRVGITMHRPGLVMILLKPETIEIGGNTFLFQATGKSAADSARRKKALAPPGQPGGVVSPGGTTGTLTVNRGQPIGALHPYDRGIGGLRFSGTEKIVEIGFKTEWVTGVP
ncbi:MAG TPA: hypothetical protein PLA43_05570 [Bryobacteraceae bacterium]|nr:hypothetical protein [Bryobacteraceae bacterium]HPQ17354.1 hypothetical protein [Bryobacteraceae bacterium]HPU71404.1 hypothetical protein [Bryobacteraceae bacterium]